ncbi:SRPBCC family protein [Burkholderiaceae bacterium UC74_6]
MDARASSSQAAAVKNRMTVERKSDRELVVTRIVNGPPRLVFEAWTQPELFKRWWVPKSLGMTLLSCELDVRVGGTYRLVFQHPAAPDGMAFHGRYLDVVPNARIVWTNEEAGGNGQVTTVTFEEKGDQTVLIVSDLYATKEALDEELAAGSIPWSDESFDQLDELLG